MTEYVEKFLADADKMMTIRRLGLIACEDFPESGKTLYIEECKPNVEAFILNANQNVIDKDSLFAFISKNSLEIVIITDEVNCDVANSDEMAELYENAKSKYNCYIFDEKRLGDYIN